MVVKIEEMKFDDGEAYRATNPLPEENNPSYPQQRLPGFRAKKMLLQQLFDNFTKLPPALLKHGSLWFMIPQAHNFTWVMP